MIIWLLRKLWGCIVELFSFVVDWTIVVGEKTVKLYVDEQCTVPMVGDVHFGQIPQGETREFTFYVRNESLIPTDVVLTTTEPPAYMTAVLNPEALTALQPAEVRPVSLTLVATADAPVDAQDSITVTGDDGTG